MDEALPKLQLAIQKNEPLRGLSRFRRLMKRPLRTSGFYFLAALARIRPFQISFYLPWGARMKSYLPEGNTFLYYGYCEANLTNFFLRTIKPGMTCFDVGAHVGFYSLMFAEMIGEEGAVYAFEPTLRTFRVLQHNTKPYHNITCISAAVGDASGNIINLADYGPGYGAYNSAHDTGAALLKRTPRTCQVSTISLDDFCQHRAVSPDIVKIDVEGLEALVLKGATMLLGSGGPRPLVTFEVAGGEVWGENQQRAIELLREYSYEVYSIEASGLLRALTHRQALRYDNFVAIPAERKDAYANIIEL